MRTMPLPEIIASLVKINGCSEQIASSFLNEFAALIVEGLADGGSVTIKGIGTFRLIELADDIAVEFAPDKSLAEAVNAPFSIFEPVELDECVTADILNEAAEHLQEKHGVESSEIGSTDETEICTQTDNWQSAPLPETSPSRTTPPGIPPIPQSEPSLSSSREIPKPSTHEDVNDSSSTHIPNCINQTPPTPKKEPADYPADRYEPRVTHERIIEKEHLVEKNDQSRHTFHIILASVLSLLAGLLLGYFAYNRLNLTGVKSVNISAEDVKVIQQVAESNTEGVTSKNSDNSMVTENTMATDTTATNSNAAEANEKDDANRADAAGNAKADATKVVTDTVKSNRYLTTMALKHYGKKKFWVYIYEENKAKLPNPDMIPANTVVVIPPASKYGIEPGNPDSEADAEKRAAEIAKHQH